MTYKNLHKIMRALKLAGIIVNNDIERAEIKEAMQIILNEMRQIDDSIGDRRGPGGGYYMPLEKPVNKYYFLKAMGYFAIIIACILLLTYELSK